MSAPEKPKPPTHQERVESVLRMSIEVGPKMGVTKQEALLAMLIVELRCLVNAMYETQ